MRSYLEKINVLRDIDDVTDMLSLRRLGCVSNR